MTAKKCLDGEFTHCANAPDKYDTYLVHTEEGCKDFAHFNGEGWHPGSMSDGTPQYWMPIPQLPVWMA